MLRNLDPTPAPLPGHPTPPPTPDWFTPQPAAEVVSLDQQYEYSDRPMSTRSTGLRGNMMRALNSTSSDTGHTGLLRDQPIAGGSGESGLRPISGPSQPISGPSRPINGPSRPISGPSRPVCGHTSGLHSQLIGQTHGHDTVDDFHETVESELGTEPQFRPASTRLTGVRGELQKGPVQQSASSPNSRPPRTAVLASGHRPLRVGPLETDLVTLPAIATSEMREREEREREEVDSTSPLFSTEEPHDSAHIPHPSSNLEECMASISHFDHTHRGQLDRRHRTGEDRMHLHNVDSCVLYML